MLSPIGKQSSINFSLQGFLMPYHEMKSKYKYPVLGYPCAKYTEEKKKYRMHTNEAYEVGGVYEPDS
jgi:hypothetical protein